MIGDNIYKMKDVVTYSLINGPIKKPGSVPTTETSAPVQIQRADDSINKIAYILGIERFDMIIFFDFE